MYRYEGSSFALVLVSLVACGDSRDPSMNTFGDDDGIEIETESGSSAESQDDDADSTTIRFDELPDDESSDTDTTEETGTEESGCEKVDLLFVIDNSGSMEDEQGSLVNSFPAFIEEIQIELANADSYHIGVISTDDYEFNEGCVAEGAMIIKTGGQGASKDVCGPFAAGYNYMTEEDDLDIAFSCTAQIGIDGDGDERGLQTMQAALSDAMVGPGGCNEGFLRDDALLVVVLITDEEDDHEVDACNLDPKPGSNGDPPDWFEGLVAVKGGLEQTVVVLSLIGPPGPDPEACPALDKCQGGIEGAEIGQRITEFTNMFTYGFVGRVCEPSYASFFDQAVSVIKGACEDFPPIE